MASRSSWDAKHRAAQGGSPPADPFLAEAWALACERLPLATTAADIAAGRGRHALALAKWGLDVVAIDFSREALLACDKLAQASGLEIATQCTDLERDGADLGDRRFDVVAVFNYLHRPLIPAIKRAIREDGIIIYKTFTRRQLAFGTGPRNLDYLLADDELAGLFEDFHHLLYRETCEIEATAALVAQRR